MLENTLILPETDARFAAELLAEAVEDLDVVLMLVFGKDETAKQIVRWADLLCSKTSVGPGTNLRKVVWIRDAGTAVRLPVTGASEAGEPPEVELYPDSDFLRVDLKAKTRRRRRGRRLRVRSEVETTSEGKPRRMVL